ncbi:MAG: hypothetical protein ABS54_14020 [Hyphomicrobium sp. SCN 65-11]|nr:MAG: hypothetical protein ABS54_14020 [Hyphomicrobium sp. SCN 65-11]
MPELIDDYPVPFRSLREIEDEMNRLRKLAGLLECDKIEPFEFMSLLHIKFAIRPESQMSGAISFATAQDNTIWATRVLAKGLRLGEPKYLQTWAHEVAHLALHRGSGPKARMAGQGNRTINFIPEENSAEHQAWLGARALLLPRSELSLGLEIEEIAAKVGVTPFTVEKRLKEIAEFESRNRS